MSPRMNTHVLVDDRQVLFLAQHAVQRSTPITVNDQGYPSNVELATKETGEENK
jgi:hypothetical protein